MDNEKLINEIHKMQNEDLDKLTNVKYPSLYYAHLSGKIEAFSNVVKLILFGEIIKEEEKVNG